MFEVECAVGVHGVEGVDGDGVRVEVVFGDALDEDALLVYDDEVSFVDEEAGVAPVLPFDFAADDDFSFDVAFLGAVVHGVSLDLESEPVASHFAVGCEVDGG